jgi:hypothetical protein
MEKGHEIIRAIYTRHGNTYKIVQVVDDNYSEKMPGEEREIEDPRFPGGKFKTLKIQKEAFFKFIDQKSAECKLTDHLKEALRSVTEGIDRDIKIPDVYVKLPIMFEFFLDGVVFASNIYEPIIKRLVKEQGGSSGRTPDDVEKEKYRALLEKCRKSNGEPNWREIGRRLKIDGKTVKYRCEHKYELWKK